MRLTRSIFRFAIELVDSPMSRSLKGILNGVPNCCLCALAVLLGLCVAGGTEDRGSGAELIAEYCKTHDSAILRSLSEARRSGGTVTGEVLVGFAPLIAEETDDERAVCDVLDLIIEFDSISLQLKHAVADRFSQGEPKDLFARPKAAAVLVKFAPGQYGAREWLEGRLGSEEKVVRLTAAAALESLGEGALASSRQLEKLLDDESAIVRVVAAKAILRQQTREATDERVVTVLLESLKCADESLVLTPIGVSEAGFPTHRWLAVKALGKTTIRRDEVARKLLSLLSEEDVRLRFSTLEALAKIGVRDKVVIDAVRAQTTAVNKSVAAQAARTLKALGAAGAAAVKK